MNNYLLYSKVNIQDSPKSKNNFLDDKSRCIEICSSENNCQGINIVNPTCEKNDTLTKCLNENINNTTGVNTINSENLTQYNCNFLTNINDTNYVLDSDKNTSFIKNEFVNKLNNLSLDKKYYLKINNRYIGIKNINNQTFLIPIDDINLASKFKFNSNSNIIESKTNKCIQSNGNYLVLKDCIQNNPTQQFIYENKTNTIRPITNSSDNNLCLSFNDDDNDMIVLEECDLKKKLHQSIDTQINNLFESKSESASNIEENFDVDGLIDLKNINFCSNHIYKTVVTLILVGILVYFIWYLIRKKYKDNDDTFQI